MPRIIPAILALYGLLHSTLVAAVPITDILFEGNNTTRDKVLRKELLIKEGDEADPQTIEASRQSIMNLGLFKNVGTRLEEADGGRRLIFTVEERFYLLPIPLIGVKPKNGNAAEGIGSYNYGMELRYDNVAGLNHRLKIVYEDEDSQATDVPSNNTLSLSYTIPHLIDSPYRLALDAKQVKEDANILSDDTVIGSYHLETTSGGFYLSRWLNPKGISRGWSAGAGVSARVNRYTEMTGAALGYKDHQLLQLKTGINYSDVAEHPYHREGTNYGYDLVVASQALGSDYAFTRHYLYFRRYQPLSFSDSNLNTQVKVGLAAESGTAFSLDNSALLRGYESNFVTGNAMLLINTEYHHHISGYRQLRGVVFIDAGNAWKDAGNIQLGQLHSSIGVGLRWRVQSFVNVTLRIDYAQALATGDTKIILNTSASF